MATTFANVSVDAPNVWVERRMYRLAEKYLRVGKYHTRYQLPQRFSKTVRVVRYKRLALPTATLTEGVPPADVQLATENVDTAVNQWGIVVFLTDVLLLTTTHPALQIAIDRTALAIAETLEREMCVTLLGGTSIIFANARTSRAGLVATDTMGTTEIVKATVQMRALGAGEFDGGLFAAVVPPQVEGDLIAANTVFQQAHQFVNVKAMEFGEMGIWLGCRWARGNFLPIFKGVAAPDSAAATATKAQLIGAAGGAYTAGVTLSGGVIIVARDVNTDYQRLISQTSTTFVLGAGNTALQVATPTSTNYVYDIYAPPAAAGTGTPTLAVSRAPGATTQTISALPTGTTSVPSAPGSGVEVFVTFFFGKDAVGRVELNGMSLQSYITPPGPSFSNPLAQGRKVGAKIAWNSFILDNNFFLRLESGSAYSAQLPT